MTILSYILFVVVRLFTWSYRFTYLGQDKIQKAKSISPIKTYILSIWHQNLFAGIMAQWGTDHVVIISKSKDAEPLARVMRMMGHTTMRGSSKKGDVDKGGKVAKNDMAEVLKTGLPGAITVDGPKGPSRIVKPGIISLALQTNAAILPYVAIAQRYWTFNSWDKFRLPKPFTRILVNYGEPLIVSDYGDNPDFEKIAIELANRMNQLEKETSF